jgi:hypothetical protein
MWGLFRILKINLDHRSNINNWKRVSQGIWGLILGSLAKDQEWIFE